MIYENLHRDDFSKCMEQLRCKTGCIRSLMNDLDWKRIDERMFCVKFCRKCFVTEMKYKYLRNIYVNDKGYCVNCQLKKYGNALKKDLSNLNKFFGVACMTIAAALFVYTLYNDVIK
jgi:hypothetical protein